MFHLLILYRRRPDHLRVPGARTVRSLSAPNGKLVTLLARSGAQWQVSKRRLVTLLKRSVRPAE
jgi:hypothetical protein